MDLYFGKITSVPNGYIKRNSFKGFSFYTKTFDNGRQHYYDICMDGVFYAVFGNFYLDYLGMENPALMCRKAYINGGLDKVFSMDGDFIFIRMASETDIIIMQSNYGGDNLYYKINGEEKRFSTEASLLMDDFSESDLDDRSVSDFLLYGLMVGGNTFSKRVKCLVRGQVMTIDKGDKNVKNFRVIKFDVSSSDINEDEIISKLTDKYLRAVEKCTFGEISDCGMFLSGGKDSRLLLAAFSELSDKKITCISFGQFGANETRNAEITASINNNPFILVNLRPDDHIKYAKEYVKESIGMDWFPQSYIISVLKQLSGFSKLFSGSHLSDICFHSKHLDKRIGNYIGNLTEYMWEHHAKAAMRGFSREKLRWLCGGRYDGLYKMDHMDEDTSKYDGTPEEFFIAYMNNVRGANQMRYRAGVFPGKYMDVYDPAQDKRLIEEVRHLPLSMRLSDTIHTRMLQKINSAYLQPVYSDYNIPMQMTCSYSEFARTLEEQREQLYIHMMQEYNPNHENKIYYNHDYADFNGYMKYDNSWISYMDGLLLDRDAYIYKRYFVYERVKQMLFEHRSNIMNWKRELILLSSLEQFLRIYI